MLNHRPLSLNGGPMDPQLYSQLDEAIDKCIDAIPEDEFGPPGTNMVMMPNGDVIDWNQTCRRMQVLTYVLNRVQDAINSLGRLRPEEVKLVTFEDALAAENALKTTVTTEPVKK